MCFIDSESSQEITLQSQSIHVAHHHPHHTPNHFGDERLKLPFVADDSPRYDDTIHHHYDHHDQCEQNGNLDHDKANVSKNENESI